MSHYGLQKAKVKGFKAVPLPAFLEGPARMMGYVDTDTAREMFNNVKRQIFTIANLECIRHQLQSKNAQWKMDVAVHLHQDGRKEKMYSFTWNINICWQ